VKQKRLKLKRHKNFCVAVGTALLSTMTVAFLYVFPLYVERAIYFLLTIEIILFVFSAIMGVLTTIYWLKKPLDLVALGFYFIPIVTQPLIMMMTLIWAFPPTVS